MSLASVFFFFIVPFFPTLLLYPSFYSSGDYLWTYNFTFEGLIVALFNPFYLDFEPYRFFWEDKLLVLPVVLVVFVNPSLLFWVKEVVLFNFDLDGLLSALPDFLSVFFYKEVLFLSVFGLLSEFWGLPLAGDPTFGASLASIVDFYTIIGTLFCSFTFWDASQPIYIGLILFIMYFR